MKKINPYQNRKLFLTVTALTVIMLLAIFSACSVTRSPDTTPDTAPDTAPDTSTDTLFQIDGTTLRATVPNSTEALTFTTEMPFLADADSFYLSTDAEGNAPIDGATVSLSAGNNTFYLFVVSGSDTKVYTVEINRNELLTVTFDTGNGTPIEALQVEKGTVIAPPSTDPILSGHSFTAWSFDFSLPITKDLVIKAEYTVLPEMENFIFTAYADHCEITGVKNTGVTKLTVPDCVTVITEGALGECVSLNSLSVPFVGGSADAQNGTKESLFGYIFGSGPQSMKNPPVTIWYQYLTNNSQFRFYIPSTLVEITVRGGLIHDRAFYGNSTTPTVILGDGVSYVGRESFQDSFPLMNVTVRGSVTAIGESAFSGCKSLKTFNLYGSVTDIEKKAFWGCTALKSFSFNEGLKTIGDSAFENVPLKGDIVFPESLESIGAKAFCGVQANSVTVASATIGESAFQDSTVKSAVIGNGVTEVGKYAFSRCASLTTVKLPESVTVLSDGLFESCSQLSDITFSKSLTYIGEGAFLGCSALTAVTLPDTVSTVSAKAFKNCSALKTANLPHAVTTLSVSVFENCSSLEMLTIGANITSIGNYALRGCVKLTGIDIPAKTNSIGSMAFMGCASLTTLTVPEGVTRLSASVFEDCSGLTSVKLHDEITSIGEKAFNNCTSLSNVIIPQKLTTLGEYAYARTAITTATLPKGITRILKSAFMNCQNLETVVFEGNVTVIEGMAFAGCIKLRNIELPEGLTEIGGSAFSSCSALTEITLPSTLTFIKAHAFAGSGLISVVIPHSVTEIENRAFSECKSLLSATVGNGVQVINVGTFENCIALENVVFGESVRELTAHVFDGCKSIKSIYIPDSLEVIDGSIVPTLKGIRISENSTRFKIENSALVDVITKTLIRCWGEVYIPADGSVEILGAYCFSGCTVKDGALVIPNSVTTVRNNIFINGIETLYLGSGIKVLESPLVTTTVPIKNVHIEDLAAWCGVQVSSTANPLTYAETVYYNGEPISKLTIPDGVKEIKSDLFYNCKWMTELVLPDSVGVIRESAFYGCSSLIVVTMGKKIEKIEEFAFAYCSSLISVTLGKRLITVEDSAFYKCAVKEIALNECTLSFTMGSKAYGEIAEDAIYIHEGKSDIVTVGDYYFLKVDGEYQLLSYKGKDETAVLPENVNGEGYKIGQNVISHKSIKHLVIPRGVYEIGVSAFAGISSLESVVCNSTSCVISASAFKKCTALKTVTFNGINGIGESAFEGCTALESFTVISGNGTVGKKAFYDCASLTAVTLPEGFTEIGESSFDGCILLREVSLPDSLTTIRRIAFRGCEKLEILRLGKGIKLIEEEIFALSRSNHLANNRITELHIADITGWCNIELKKSYGEYYAPTNFAYNVYVNGVRITTLTIPEGITSISPAAFMNMDQLKEIIFPSSLTEIGDYAFSSCDMLKTLKIGKNVSVIGISAFSSCYKLYSVTLSASLTEIGNSAFGNCQALIEVVRNGCTLNLTLGGEAYGGVAYSARIISDSEESAVVTADGYSFITVNVVSYMVDCLIESEKLTLPTDYNGSPYAINTNAFYKSTVKEMTIPDGSVSEILNDAFYHAELESLYIGKGMVILRRGAFYNTYNLAVIKLYKDTILETNAYNYNYTTLEYLDK